MQSRDYSLNFEYSSHGPWNRRGFVVHILKYILVFRLEIATAILGWAVDVHLVRVWFLLNECQDGSSLQLFAALIYLDLLCLDLL